MPLSRLELVSSHGDQTLGNVRFVLHGTSNGADSRAILSGGLRFVEGRPTVSTNLIHAQDWTVNPVKQAQSLGQGAVAGDPGDVIVCTIPSNFYLGYGVFTNAYVDRQLKRVTGAPLRYAAGRKQLAFYLDANTETARMHVESEVANGFSLSQRPQFVLEPKFLMGSFRGPVLSELAKQLDVAAKMFEPVNFGSFEEALREQFTVMNQANVVLVPTIARDVLIGTIESVVISRMRMMRWQGLALLGFVFTENHQQVQIEPVRDLVEQRARIDELGRRLATSALFTAEISWLKSYVATQLELMRIELEAAELEAASD